MCSEACLLLHIVCVVVTTYLIHIHSTVSVGNLSHFFHRFYVSRLISLQEKRQQILNEMRTLCEACCYPGLVEFQGAFYMPDSGQISIALEYMDGGSLADVIRVKKSIPEPVLSHMLQKVLLVWIFHKFFSFYASISKNRAVTFCKF